VIKIKTQNIQSELFVQMDGEKEIPKTAKESFLKALVTSFETEGDAGKETSKETATERLPENLELENVEDEDSVIPLIPWLPQVTVFEDISFKKGPKEHLKFNEVINKDALLNKLDNLPVNEKELFETTLNRSDLKMLVNEKITDESFFQFEKQPKTLRVDNLADNLASTQSINSDQMFRSFIADQVEFKGLSSEAVAPEVSTEISLEDSMGKRKPSKQASLPLQQKLRTNNIKTKTLAEKIFQIKGNVTQSDEIDVDHLNKPRTETEFVSPMRQITEATPRTVNIELPETVSVPAERWVREVEAMVLDQIDKSPRMKNKITAHLQLTPEKLGEMDIELIIQNRELTAKIVVEYAETKDWLEQKVQQLNTTLATQDIQVNDVQVVIGKQKQGAVDAGVQDNPFFQQKEEQSKKKRSLGQAVEKEQVEETHYKKMNPNNGRLSIWV